MHKIFGMRYFFTVACVMIWAQLCWGATKSDDVGQYTLINNQVDKLGYPKKVTSIKKTISKSSNKKLTDLVEKFKHLPENDLSFIKELDRQFALYGAKIRIKVENVNISAKKKGEKNKSIKRTVDGNLGYGYLKQEQNSYEHNSPKFMFYPYSQEDITSQEPKYYIPEHRLVTTVTVEPSYSFELKSETYLQPPQPYLPTQSIHDAKNGLREEPVIVLRIPGPPKYAEHLKSLLQQYLEVKAAQYLRILEENELRKYPQNSPEVHEQQQQQEDYTDDQQQHQHQHFSQFNQADNDHIYHNSNYQYPITSTHHLEENHHHNPYEGQTVEAPQNYPTAIQQHPESRLLYYTHNQQYIQSDQDASNNYAQAYLLSTGSGQPFIYVTKDNEGKKSEAFTLPVTENNPRGSHTKVIFTKNNNHATRDTSQNYPLPSIKPKEFHSPTSIPVYHQDFRGLLSPKEDALESKSSTGQVVTITQRPHNYHAHKVQQFSNRELSQKRRAIHI